MATMTFVAERGTRPKAIWIVAVILCMLAGAGVWVYRRGALRARETSGQGQWVSAQRRDISTTVNATGTVRLKTGAEVRVGAQISGIVRKLNVTVGSKVHQNDVIAVLDSQTIQSKVQQAQTQLLQAQTTLAKAETDNRRATELFQSGLIPRQQFDDVAASLNAAKATVNVAESGVDSARVDLDYVQIRAPISGTIASVSTQQGETVAASFSTPTFVTIIQPSALEVIAMVDEADIGNVKVGQHAAFTVESYPDHEFAGIVTRIAPAATIVSGVVNYEVVTSINKDINMLRPDMTANVTIDLSTHKAIVVPSGSIRKEDGHDYLEVRSGSGTPEKRRVTVGARIGSEVEISSGLSQDALVRVGSSTGEKR